MFHQPQTKPGLSRLGLDWDSQSRHRQKVCLDSQENLNIFKKFVSTDREILISIGLNCRDPQAYQELTSLSYLVLKLCRTNMLAARWKTLKWNKFGRFIDDIKKLLKQKQHNLIDYIFDYYKQTVYLVFSAIHY